MFDMRLEKICFWSGNISNEIKESGSKRAKCKLHITKKVIRLEDGTCDIEHIVFTDPKKG